jgi:hypothetical protein
MASSAFARSWGLPVADDDGARRRKGDCEMKDSGRLKCAGLVVGLALLGFVGVAQAQEPVDPNAYIAGPTVYPATLPPDPIPEYRPGSPGYGFSWIDGYWDWTGYDWAWNNGYWVQGRPGWAYFGPRFIWENGQPVYNRGFWQRPDGYREYRYGGGGYIAPGWYARPRYEPRYWRADPGHSTAWRRAPGAPPGGYREAPRFEHRGVEHREMEHREAEHREGMERREEGEHREAEHREAEHREMGGREEAHPAGFHGSEPHPGPAGGPPPHQGGAPAPHGAPAAAPQRGKKK